MQYKAVSTPAAKTKTACLVVMLFSDKRLSEETRALDKATGGAIRAVLRRKDFNGERGETQLLYLSGGALAERVLLLGAGARKAFSAKVCAQACGAATKLLQEANASSAAFLMPLEKADRQDVYGWTRAALEAIEASLYRFDECKTEPKAMRGRLRSIIFLGRSASETRHLERALQHGEAIASGMRLAKDLSNLPGNLCTPGYLADAARKLGRSKRKLKVSVLEEKDMEKLGMGALLSVSRGSREPAKLIVMEYKGGKAGDKPVALVGKGLTFDAGGISIKPAQDMDQMKYDMCGGASVFGTIAACVEMDLPLNVVGVVPASENLPDGAANKPGDIVTSMSGQTIEILNTDAEGRLILCDALTYSKRFEPAAVIDIATLTGACIIALGHHASGLLANDDRLAGELLAASESTGDRAWQLPLWDDFQEQLDSNFADMANIGGRAGGTITAACFLSRYTGDFKWAHLDIAGTAWKTGADKGATGRPVPLLTQFLMNRCKIPA